jgi:hypothetical protein
LDSHKVFLLSLSGVFALLLNLASFFVINKTSSLTYTVAGNLKVALSVAASVIVFGNEVTFMNAVGCGVTIAGVMWYQTIKEESAAGASIPLSLSASGSSTALALSSSAAGTVSGTAPISSSSSFSSASGCVSGVGSVRCGAVLMGGE